ncbi:hypothetical protein H4R33_000518 [Dimargaris cristalligena]|uniref:Uncharacterized protein n=1 Tax=Dimargaris cristalligena TaxID=215637 RepID=A0A4P9ZNR2_9FUNG|nr:hypothetical protein H4R33_000518 [Dimargaris cristalligena]RKP34933.1 hypothetical protein BJ085DRAFT_27822 [Dimargaris cristalligena]|eukprot:RKP34933.1 hypothetical protein BJ085DRAFT_27822 [Dimargaris cristalligena]
MQFRYLVPATLLVLATITLASQQLTWDYGSALPPPNPVGGTTTHPPVPNEGRRYSVPLRKNSDLLSLTQPSHLMDTKGKFDDNMVTTEAETLRAELNQLMLAHSENAKATKTGSMARGYTDTGTMARYAALNKVPRQPFSRSASVPAIYPHASTVSGKIKDYENMFKQ